jgi:Rap1a immunity proteins
MKTSILFITPLILLLGAATIAAQDQTKVEVKNGTDHGSKEPHAESTPKNSTKSSEDSELTSEEKARAHELERYLGQAYVDSQAELVDQLFSPDWRGFNNKGENPSPKQASGLGDGEGRAESANTTGPSSFKSGHDLLHDCQQPEMSSAGICAGYILGVLDMMTLDQIPDQTGAKVTNVCLPSNLDVWQVTNIIKKYLIEHPETGKLRASQAVFRGATKAWGCTAK